LIDSRREIIGGLVGVRWSSIPYVARSTIGLFSNSYASYCLSNALHSSIGQNIKSHTCPLSGVRCTVRSPAGVWKLQMVITQQRVIRSTSCLVLGWFF